MVVDGTYMQSETAMAKSVTFRLEEDKIDTLDALAASMHRDRSFLLNEAVENYLDLKQWQIAQIRVALAEADAGQFATDEEVRAAFAAFKATT
jgi:predicted transcriptional regulator